MTILVLSNQLYMKYLYDMKNLSGITFLMLVTFIHPRTCIIDARNPVKNITDI